MKSKEALNKLFMACDNDLLYEQSGIMSAIELTTIIEQDLNKLEKLEKENKVLREKVNHFKNVKNRMRRNCKFYEKENTKLKKVIEILEKQLLGQTISQQEYELLEEVLGNA